MITDNDVKKLKKVFATKEELKYSADAIIKYIDLRLKPVDEFKKDFAEFKGSVLKSLEWLAGAFKKFDEEHTILTEKYSDVNVKLTNHEDRILKLESD